MYNRIRAGLLVVFVALAALLAAQGLRYAPQAGAGGVQMCVPKAPNGEGFAPSALAEAFGERFVYTIESQSTAVLQTELRPVSVRLLSVNAMYPRVTGLRLVRGSFFTEASEAAQVRHIVLNEAAAFALFGNDNIVGLAITLNGQIYETVGVLQDGVNEASAYVSAYLTDSAAQAVMALPDEATGVTAAHIRNAFMQIGVTNEIFYIIDIGGMNAMMPGKALFLGTLVLVWAGIAFAVVCFKRFGSGVAGIRASGQRYYVGELMRHEGGLVVCTAAWGLLFFGLAAGLLGLVMVWIELFLVYAPMQAVMEWNRYMLPYFTAVFAPVCAANAQSSIVLAVAVGCLVCLWVSMKSKV